MPTPYINDVTIKIYDMLVVVCQKGFLKIYNGGEPKDEESGLQKESVDNNMVVKALC